jgi:hypothetical protein
MDLASCELVAGVIDEIVRVAQVDEAVIALVA